jgi:hypothetical protein
MQGERSVVNSFVVEYFKHYIFYKRHFLWHWSYQRRLQSAWAGATSYASAACTVFPIWRLAQMLPS